MAVNMIVDIFVLVDDAPVILKRPLLPFSPASYRIPIYADYNPQATNWPEDPWYHTQNTNVHTVLVGNRRFEYTPNRVPAPDYFTIHVEENASFLVIGFRIETLWMYERIEIIITNEELYSLRGTKDDDGKPNPPMVLSVPDIRKKADALRYAKFSFEQTKINFIKENQSIFLFGGQMFVSLIAKETEDGQIRPFPIGRYIIDKVSHGEDTATLTGVDYRSLLNSMYPVETFWGTVEEEQLFPFLEEKYRNQIKPACIGIGNGIPGICLNGLQIFNMPMTGILTTITHYDFQFPPGFIIDDPSFKIEVKATGTPTVGELRPNDTWIEIFPGLGNPHYNTFFQTPNPNPPIMNSQTGIVSIHFTQALQGGQFGNAPNEIRMFARWPNQRMKDAIISLLKIAHEDLAIEVGEKSEFSPHLADIGLYMDESKSIFEWIEKIQSGSTIGGQLMLVNDVLTFRLENPNRPKKIRENGKPLDILKFDALNHENLQVSIAEEFIYSGWDISYIKSWAQGDRGHVVGVNQRYPTADVLKGEDLTARFIRTGIMQSSFDLDSVRKRVNIINNLVRTFRHKITGLEVPMTFDYLELLIYDVVGYIPKVLENDNINYEWIVYNKKINLRDETILLDLVQRVRTDFWNNGNP